MDDDDSETERARFSKFQRNIGRPHASVVRERPSPRPLVGALARAEVGESVKEKEGAQIPGERDKQTY